jgi:hypothetical protein
MTLRHIRLLHGRWAKNSVDCLLAGNILRIGRYLQSADARNPVVVVVVDVLYFAAGQPPHRPPAADSFIMAAAPPSCSITLSYSL